MEFLVFVRECISLTYDHFAAIIVVEVTCHVLPHAPHVAKHVTRHVYHRVRGRFVRHVEPGAPVPVSEEEKPEIMEI